MNKTQLKSKGTVSRASVLTLLLLLGQSVQFQRFADGKKEKAICFLCTPLIQQIKKDFL